MNDTEKITLNTKQTILLLRSVLGTIADASYSFSKINREYPLDTLDETKGKQIATFYMKLIRDVLNSLKPYENEASITQTGNPETMIPSSK